MQHADCRFSTVNIAALCMHAQMISTITGAVLDSFTLTKPAGWKPDLAGRTSFLANFKQSYFPGGPYVPAQSFSSALKDPASTCFHIPYRPTGTPAAARTLRPQVCTALSWCTALRSGHIRLSLGQLQHPEKMSFQL